MSSTFPTCLCVDRSTWTRERGGSTQQLLPCPTTSSSFCGRTAPALLGRLVPIPFQSPPPLSPLAPTPCRQIDKLQGSRAFTLLSAAFCWYKNAAHSFPSASIRQCGGVLDLGQHLCWYLMQGHSGSACVVCATLVRQPDGDFIG